MKRFFDPCRHHRKEISLSVAGLLSESEMAAIQRHLDICEGCRSFHAEMKSVSAPLINWGNGLTTVTDARFEARWTKAVHAANESAIRKRRNSAPATWQDFLLSFRWHLTGLSALWLLITFLNLETPVSSGATMAQRNKASTEQVVASLRANRQQILELMELTGAPAAPIAVPPASPRRRSEIDSTMEMV